MTAATESAFIFALTNPGSENPLKQEAAAMQLGWRPGYQRRGIVTFKVDRPFACDPLLAELAFARRLCFSLGKAPNRDEAMALLAARPEVEIIHEAKFHERKMQGLHPENADIQPRPGQWVGTIVELAENEFWCGVHRHARFLSPDPAGDGGLVMPERSPSRAWLKLEEALRFFAVEISRRDVVVELGASPGGVVLALLDRGVPVIGVDPAKMSDVVMASAIESRAAAPAGRPWFYHCRKPAALVGKRDLGQGVTWFMSDMNQSPDVVLRECARFCKMAPSIRNVLVTLKLTDQAQIVEKPKWFAALTGLGFREIRLQQFSVHHRELALLAIR